jgi:hypothetical protein
MSAQRVACQGPWGNSYELLVLQGHVIVPRALGHIPSLWWLGDEHHPRVAVTLVSALEEATGADVGIAPYCVPTERWNIGAAPVPWLPQVPAHVDASLGSLAGERWCEERYSLPISAQVQVNDLDTKRLRGLHAGRQAAIAIFTSIRRLFAAGMVAALGLALAYYMMGTGAWLWELRHGISGRRTQDGIVILIFGLAAMTMARLLSGRMTRRSARLAGRWDVEKISSSLLTIVDGFRLGIALQLLAFGGFILL